MKVYPNFSEVEKDIESKTPSVIYKYRDWENDNHKRIISANEIWFARLDTLNDPYDLRPPYNFICEDIDWNIAKQKIWQAGKYYESDLPDEQLKINVEKRLSEMKSNPSAYFQKTRNEFLLDKTNFDKIGVFSCCLSAENESMWAHYGNNHKGFVIGFDTVELAKKLNCTFGFVDYNDTPINYYVLGNNEHLINEEIFRKSTKWQQEQEVRFITVGIGVYRERKAVYPPSIVKEVVFGMSTSKKIQNEIMTLVEERIPKAEFFKVTTNSSHYGLEKIRLQK